MLLYTVYTNSIYNKKKIYKDIINIVIYSYSFFNFKFLFDKYFVNVY